MALRQCGLNLDRARRELQPHGTLGFPCAGYAERCEDGPEEFIPWHWHEELEIVFAASGSLRVRVPGRTFLLEEGEGVALNADVLHSASGLRGEARSLVFGPLLISGGRDTVFARRYIEPLLACAAFDGCPLGALADGDVFPAREFVSAFDALAHDAPGYEFLVREKLSRIVLALYRRYERDIGAGCPAPDPDRLRIRKMLDYIHERFADDIRLSHIAEAGGVGERECLRAFRRTLRVSPVQYLLKHRAAQGASMLLRDRGRSVSEIAGACGFDSPSRFSQLFKRFFKCAPREYRKQKTNV